MDCLPAPPPTAAARRSIVPPFGVGAAVIVGAGGTGTAVRAAGRHSPALPMRALPIEAPTKRRLILKP